MHLGHIPVPVGARLGRFPFLDPTIAQRHVFLPPKNGPYRVASAPFLVNRNYVTRKGERQLKDRRAQGGAWEGIPVSGAICFAGRETASGTPHRREGSSGRDPGAANPHWRTRPTRFFSIVPALLLSSPECHTRTRRYTKCLHRWV